MFFFHMFLFHKWLDLYLNGLNIIFLYFSLIADCPELEIKVPFYVIGSKRRPNELEYAANWPLLTIELINWHYFFLYDDPIS